MFIRISLLLCVVLQGCVTGANSQVNFTEFQASGKKAIVSVNSQAIERGLFFDSKKPVSFSLSKVDRQYFTKDRLSYSISHMYSPSLDLLMIEAGTYVIENIYWQEDRTTFSSTQPGLTTGGTILYGAIQVKENQIYDLGILLFEADAGSLKCKSSPDIEAARMEISRHHGAELAKRPIDPLRLVPPNTKLVLSTKKGTE